MKLEKIKFNNHEIFNNLEIDFKDSNGKILDTIVIIGENGSGKTTLLKSIYDSFEIDQRGYEEYNEYLQFFLNDGHNFPSLIKLYMEP